VPALNPATVADKNPSTGTGTGTDCSMSSIGRITVRAVRFLAAA
jgi:hypothetical protein